MDWSKGEYSGDCGQQAEVLLALGMVGGDKRGSGLLYLYFAALRFGFTESHSTFTGTFHTFTIYVFRIDFSCHECDKNH